MAGGELRFGEIARLVDNWWTSAPLSDPAAVWKTWERDTLYLWGANSRNYKGLSMGALLHGDGMASVSKGPSRGRAHPNYIGVITMDVNDMPKNDAVFQALATHLTGGGNVVVPIYKGQWSFGTGAGVGVSDWGEIQQYLLNHVVYLGKYAGTVTIPAGAFWPDDRNGPDGKQYPIATLQDLTDIVNNVLSSSVGNQKVSGRDGASDTAMAGRPSQTQPLPKSVQVNGETYDLVAFYYPDHATAWDVRYQAGCLGNFYHPCTVTLDHPNPNDGKPIKPTPQFKTSEAAFQALKWWGHDNIRKEFEDLTDGNGAYRLSKKYEDTKGPDYVAPDLTYAQMGSIDTHEHRDQTRNKAMELVLKQKFAENPKLKTALLGTGAAYLLEHSSSSQEDYWSDYYTGAGKNMLGRTLMKVREEFGGAGAPKGTDNDAIVSSFTTLV